MATKVSRRRRAKRARKTLREKAAFVCGLAPEKYVPVSYHRKKHCHTRGGGRVGTPRKKPISDPGEPLLVPLGEFAELD